MIFCYSSPNRLRQPRLRKWVPDKSLEDSKLKSNLQKNDTSLNFTAVDGISWYWQKWSQWDCYEWIWMFIIAKDSLKILPGNWVCLTISALIIGCFSGKQRLLPPGLHLSPPSCYVLYLIASVIRSTQSLDPPREQVGKDKATSKILLGRKPLPNLIALFIRILPPGSGNSFYSCRISSHFLSQFQSSSPAERAWKHLCGGSELSHQRASQTYRGKQSKMLRDGSSYCGTKTKHKLAGILYPFLREGGWDLIVIKSL